MLPDKIYTYPTMNTDPNAPKTAEMEKPCTHHTSTTGFTVEVRCTSVAPQFPIAFTDGIVTESWRRVSFSKGMNPAGVPILSELGGYTDLMPYESALALAWTIIAQNRHSIGIQCRIVAYKHTADVKIQRIGPMSDVDYSYIKEGLPDPNDGGETEGIIKPTFGAYRYARRQAEKCDKNEKAGGAEKAHAKEARADAKYPYTLPPGYGSKEWLEEVTQHFARLKAAVDELTPEQRMKHGLPAGITIPA